MRRGAAGALLGVGCIQDPAFLRFAPPWQRFTAGGEMAGAYDTARLSWRGDTARVWVRAQYPELQRYPGDSTLLFAATEVRLAVRCAAGVARTERALVRGAAGDSVAGHTWESQPWHTFARHELGAAILGDLCLGLPRAQPR